MPQASDGLQLGVASRSGFGVHPADIGIAENDTALLGLGKRNQGRDNERNAPGHQARNEVNIASQPVQFRNNDGVSCLGLRSSHRPICGARLRQHDQPTY
jgi:hypothetical protein